MKVDCIRFAYRANQLRQPRRTPQRIRKTEAALGNVPGADRNVAQSRRVEWRRVGVARVPDDLGFATRGETRGELPGDCFDAAPVAWEIVRHEDYPGRRSEHNTEIYHQTRLIRLSFILILFALLEQLA